MSGLTGFASLLLREFDARLAQQDFHILAGSYTSFEDYRAACASRRTWLAARDIVVAALRPDEGDQEA